MSIIFCGVAPHPPVCIPRVGGEAAHKVKATHRAMVALVEKVKNSGAEILIIISPHGYVFQDGIGINGNPKMKGSLAQFEAPDIAFIIKNHLKLAKEIQIQAARMQISTAEIDGDVAREFGFEAKLDHGIMVPYYFLDQAGVKLPVVSISMGMLPFEDLYAFGVALERSAKGIGQKVALIASGDLSHRLLPCAPAGYDPMGMKFDRKVVEAVQRADAEALINLDPVLIEKAGECGIRPIIMMMGALDGRAVAAEVLSYECPFGVGYLVASLEPQKEQIPTLMEKFYAERKARNRERRVRESQLVTLARNSLEHYLRQGEIIPPPKDMPVEFPSQAGVFVSIKKHGQLRGCIGSTAPTQATLAQEIINNAISAGIHDPRFLPVEEEELEELIYTVDILSPPEPVERPDDLDPQKYGVIVSSGSRSGLLLPNLDGIDTVAEQLAVAMQKAGIEPGEPLKLQRFEVNRHQ